MPGIDKPLTEEDIAILIGDTPSITLEDFF